MHTVSAQHSGEDKDVGTSGAPIEVVVTRLAGGPEAVRAAAALLSDAERHRARRFAFDRDATRFIGARAHLRQLLAARLGVRAEAGALEDGADGKPGLSPRVRGPGQALHPYAFRSPAAVRVFCRHANPRA